MRSFDALLALLFFVVVNAQEKGKIYELFDVIQLQL
jgi:hypothetical protein